MDIYQISREASRLVRRCGTRDPFEICRALGITVLFCEDFGSLKGMYRVIKRNRFIFISSELDEHTQRIVCAHELGHDRLHRDMAKDHPIQEYTLYDVTAKPEYEANIFAAELLLDSEELLGLIREYGYTAQQLARELNTDKNLISLKALQLSSLGYDLRTQEYESGFLK